MCLCVFIAGGGKLLFSVKRILYFIALLLWEHNFFGVADTKEEKKNAIVKNVWVTWCRLSSYHSSRLCCREATGRRCIAPASLYDVRRIVVRWCYQPRSTCPAMVRPGRPLFGRTVLKFEHETHYRQKKDLTINSQYRNIEKKIKEDWDSIMMRFSLHAEKE